MNTSYSPEDHSDKLMYCLRSLADMGETIAGVRSIDKSTREVLHIVLGTIGASKGALLTLEGNTFRVAAARGLKTGITIPIEKEHLQKLETLDSTLLPRWKPIFPEKLKNFCDEHFSDLGVALAVILRAQQKIVGIFLVSRKFMNQEYTEEDLQVLEMIGRHVSVALYNFDLRRKIQSTNFQLSRKVLHLESLHDIGLSVASFKPKSETLREVLYGSISLLDARKAFYIHIDGGTLKTGPHIGISDEMLETFIASSTYSRKFLSGKTVKLRSSREIKKIFETSSLLAVPVKTSNRLFGALAILGKESKDDKAYFTGDDQKLLEAFATQAAVALENADMQEAVIEQERLKKDLETAASIHRLIVPSPGDLPEINGYSIYGYNFPCKEVGGDYFDVIPISEDRFGFVICDVSGKGLSAALLVSTLQATFHSLFQSATSLIDIADKTNKLLIRNTPSEKFATAFLGIIDTTDGTMETVNAGHNEPLLLRSSGNIEKLHVGGYILGMFDFAEYESQKTALNPGDEIYLYTDGISEAFSPEGEDFGMERLEALVKSGIKSSPTELLREIERAIREWTRQTTPGESFTHDDFTHLAIQRK